MRRKVVALVEVVLLPTAGLEGLGIHHQHLPVRAITVVLALALRAEMVVLAAAAVRGLLAGTVAGLQPGLAVQALHLPLRGQALPEQVAVAVLVELLAQVAQVGGGKAVMQVLGLAAMELQIPAVEEAVLTPAL